MTYLLYDKNSSEPLNKCFDKFDNLIESQGGQFFEYKIFWGFLLEMNYQLDNVVITAHYNFSKGAESISIQSSELSEPVQGLANILSQEQ